jgi:hypothetical protein
VATVRWVRRLVPVLVAALVLLAAANHALAHGPADRELIQPTADAPSPPSSTPDLPAVPPVPSFPWPVALTFLGALALWLYCPRRTLAGTLVLCVAVLLLETGIHSVHHVTDSDGGATCTVHSVSQHLMGADIEVPDLEALPVAFHQIVTASAEPLLVQRALGSIQGRAPPPDPLA